MVDYSFWDKPLSEITEADKEQWYAFFDRPLSEWTEAEKQEYEEEMGQRPLFARPIAEWTQEQRREYWEERTGSPDPLPLEELKELDDHAFWVGLDYCDEEGWQMMCGCGHRQHLSGYEEQHAAESLGALCDRPMLCNDCQEKEDATGQGIEIPFIGWYIDVDAW